MKWSQLLSPTLKETPADAQVVSHQLMVRAGLIRKVASGIYSLLPLGLKIMRKLETIVREEMNKAGAQEVLLPMVTPGTLWQESGRWDKYGRELCRLKDRHDNDFCLGPTHEEVITDLVRQTVRSYKELPLNLYQIQTKFRDEIRPRFGLMRGREFIMKDAYSFHSNLQDLDTTYTKMANAYTAIFNRCGLSFKMVEADSGSIGGDSSAEFMVTADTGEDAIINCTQCHYAANVEAAKTRRPNPVKSTNNLPKMTPIATPNQKTIQEVAQFLNLNPNQTIKTLLYKADTQWIGILIRGDLELNEIKLAALFPNQTLVKPTDLEIETDLQLPVGFLGPVNAPAKLTWIADHSIESLSTCVIGANQPDLHFKDAVLNRDFTVTQIDDLQLAKPGEPCPHCENGILSQVRGIEVGHIFKLGTVYSAKMKAHFLDDSGREQPFIMGCYGIGIGRTVAAAIEQHHDDAGIAWPKALAPFEVNIIIANMKNQALIEAANQIYQTCQNSGVDVILDDRECSAGVKFKDSELIGIPIVVVVGKTFDQDGKVEIKLRGQTNGILSSLNTVSETLKSLITNGA